MAGWDWINWILGSILIIIGVRYTIRGDVAPTIVWRYVYHGLFIVCIMLAAFLFIVSGNN